MAVEVKGLAEAIRHLEAVQARARNLKPVLDVAAADTVALIDDAFETSISPSGRPWPGLASSTERQRRKGRGRGSDGTTLPHKILVDTGRLRGSINATGDAHNLRFGTNVGYGLFHQAGTRRMPSRAFLPIDGSPGLFALATSGPAGSHWQRVRDAVRRYVLTGEVS